MPYVLVNPNDKYFVNPSFNGWDFTEDVNKATKFESFVEVCRMKDTIERAIATTYWDYDDIIPYPRIKQI